MTHQQATFMSTLVELETKRLRLRQWRSEDREPFASLNADPDVMQFFPQPLMRKDSDATATRIEAGIQRRGWGLWAVEVRGGEAFIGFVGLAPVPENMPFSPAVEVGWRLAKAHWGRGYATEAAEAALATAFRRLSLSMVVSFTTLANHRSLAVMERIGMECSEEFDHPDLPDGHSLRRHLLYRLSLQRWHLREVQSY
jgi:RimJ/RimL family protein N-acetyltransferase